MTQPANPNRRRTGLLLAALAAATVLAGCATLNQLSADVSTFGDWPADRKPASYAFDRMPSQQAHADEQGQLEQAAQAALAQAGFQPVAAGSEPDVLVQIGARTSRAERSPWDDPLWWRGGFGYFPGRYGLWHGPYWGLNSRWAWNTSGPRYEREVALLLRERVSGKPLYEARASNEGYSPSAEPLLAPLFAAAMAGFPTVQPEPHRVTVPLTN
jgi:hypothetical protein